MQQHDSTTLPGAGRLEAFSDGVLAIVITLLILEIKVPHLEAPGSAAEAMHALGALFPKFLGYLLSFLFIAVFWINHHRFFQLVAGVDQGLLWLNITLLLALSFIPFPTGFIGEYPGNGTALALFALVLMAAGIAFRLMWQHAASNRLFRDGVDPALVDRAKRRGLVGPVLYACAAALAFVAPYAAWFLFAAVPLYYALPGRTKGGR